MNKVFVKRLIIGKGLGFLFGLFVLFVLPHVLPDVSLRMRIGIMLWYTMMGAIVAVFGIMDRHPLFDVRIPAWLRAAFIGGALNAILILIAYDAIAPHLATAPVFTQITPTWLIVEGAIVGMLIDVIATRKAGEGVTLVTG